MPRGYSYRAMAEADPSPRPLKTVNQKIGKLFRQPKESDVPFLILQPTVEASSNSDSHTSSSPTPSIASSRHSSKFPPSPRSTNCSANPLSSSNLSMHDSSSSPTSRSFPTIEAPNRVVGRGGAGSRHRSLAPDEFGEGGVGVPMTRQDTCDSASSRSSSSSQTLRYPGRGGAGSARVIKPTLPPKVEFTSSTVSFRESDDLSRPPSRAVRIVSDFSPTSSYSDTLLATPTDLHFPTTSPPRIVDPADDDSVRPRSKRSKYSKDRLDPYGYLPPSDPNLPRKLNVPFDEHQRPRRAQDRSDPPINEDEVYSMLPTAKDIPFRPSLSRPRVFHGGRVQSWQGEWNEGDIQDVIQKLRNL